MLDDDPPSNDLKLPFETRWTDRPKEARRWFNELEKIGVAGVIARLTAKPSVSAGSIMGVGAELQITAGFAEDWLEWRRKKEEKAQLLWKIVPVLVAILAATASVISAIMSTASFFRTP